MLVSDVQPEGVLGEWIVGGQVCVSVVLYKDLSVSSISVAHEHV